MFFKYILFIGLMLIVGIFFFNRIFWLAYWEAQIEGKNPWAKALACWRLKVKQIPKELTGYHLGLAANTVSSIIFNDLITIALLLFCGLIITSVGLFEIAMFFVVYLLVKTSMIILLFTFEDYLWHIVNPNQDEYGLHTFTEKKYPAVFGRFWIIPGEYCFAIGLSGLLIAFTGLLVSFIKNIAIIEAVKLAIIGWSVIICVLILMTLILTLKAPAIHKKAAQLKVWADENIAEK
ncbi:MAG: hypothetical protein KAS78_03990 [Candidatus Pacebacteria bacterium]|nr:hypothetical protein [Candidatus Paceibacterota bacterium]